ncbi:ABC transporter ATP-binding protein [Corynebacterium ulcerans]|uniref:ABC transporter ATP-binding protein n=1 Tax=Corynebacterium ulcerans TaxID=65058 RepID=UPI0027E4365C|nr:ABC transporter ATP-binding protein [Corynebacterium ulcerans]
MAVGMSMESVSVGYGQRLVIRDVTDAFPAGKITALLGANGCGKSTLLSAIAGLTPVHSGAITVDTPNAVLGFVTQAHAMSFPFDVVDVVLTGRVRFIGAFSSPAPKDVDAAHSALDMLGVGASGAPAIHNVKRRRTPDGDDRTSISTRTRYFIVG